MFSENYTVPLASVFSQLRKDPPTNILANTHVSFDPLKIYSSLGAASSKISVANGLYNIMM